MLTRMQTRVKPPVSSQAAPANPLTHRLAGCWLFNEGTGRVVRDASGHGHNGALSGNSFWSMGSFGHAIEFDGDNDWITMGDCLDLATDDVTLFAVVRYSAAHQTDSWNGNHIAAVAGKGYLSSAGKGYGLLIGESNQIYWQVRNLTNVFSISSDAALNDGRWYLVVGVCDRDDSAGMRLYIDGVRQNATADATSLNGIDLSGSRAFAIGAFQDESGGTWLWDFAGSIAMVCVWKRVLAETEIHRLLCDPFAMIAPRHCTAVIAQPATAGVPCAGSVEAIASTSATLRATKNIAGVAAASTSLDGTLTVAGIVSLSGTVQAHSGTSGTLSTTTRQPAFKTTLQTETPWQREALFNGMTHTAWKLGTVLTQGWFWMRRRGCTAVYRGLDVAQVDLSRILHVAEPDARDIRLPSYLSHPPGSTLCYLVRRFNSCGHQEKTTAAAMFRVAPDGQRALRRPNPVFGLTSRQIGSDTVRLAWFYCPLGQETSPDRFHLYASNSNGTIGFEHPAETIRYQGRRFYHLDVAGLAAGQHTFIVRAASAEGVEDEAWVSLVHRLVASPPQQAVVLAAQSV